MSGQGTLLVVEDDAREGDRLAMFLQENGYSTQCASSLVEAIAVCDEEVLAGVLSDNWLGDKDEGLLLGAYLRVHCRQRENRAIPFVLYTNSEKQRLEAGGAQALSLTVIEKGYGGVCDERRILEALSRDALSTEGLRQAADWAGAHSVPRGAFEHAAALCHSIMAPLCALDLNLQAASDQTEIDGEILRGARQASEDLKSRFLAESVAWAP